MMETTDCIISFQECHTGLPVTGECGEFGWRFTLDDCAEEWAQADPDNADNNLRTARQECKRLTRMLLGIYDLREAVARARAEGHEAEAI